MEPAARLFTPLALRGVTSRNCIGVSPMCRYASGGGSAGDWRLVHLGSRAVGGAGLVIASAITVTREGRIARFVEQNGAVAGIRLAHAGRKASTRPPRQGRDYASEGGRRPLLAPSADPFSPDAPVPEALDAGGISRVDEA